MAHFAEINESNIVLRVLVTNDEFPNSGYDWLIANLGGNWVQTSYNTLGGQNKTGGIALRKNFASIGYFYDPELDAFYSPSPYPSWLLDNETCQWDPPKPYPKDKKDYIWNEPTLSWVEIIGE